MGNSALRVVFMGSPVFAAGVLRRLVAQYRPVGVVTQPDRESGRGRTLTPPPVKELAIEQGLPVIQPTRLKQPDAQAQLQDWAPDLIVVAAFGQILRPAVLDLPRYGCINVHASLLPRWRGAAPIQAAILHGDTQTGISIMRMDPGIDTGPVLATQSLAIEPFDTALSLSERLSDLGGNLLVQTLPPYLAGDLLPMPQPEVGATYAAMLKKEAGVLDFSLSAEHLERQVRAYYPWPGAMLEYKGQPLKVIAARVAPTPAESLPGTHVVLAGLPGVMCGMGMLLLELVQPPGKRPMHGADFLRGVREW